MPRSEAIERTTSPSAVRRRGLLYALLGLVLMTTGGFFMGPRLSFGPDRPAAREAPPKDIAALDAWLLASERAVAGIRPGTAKGVVWADMSRQRTPWSVVYVHGFSASRLETSPLAEHVAKGLGANLFHTRLTGHGLGFEAMGRVTVQDWLADTLEAATIGQLLGERVLLISCSSGSTLATWLGLRPEGKGITAQVFISPNFGPKDKRADLLLGPWGEYMAYAIAGDTYGQASSDPLENMGWTAPYPTRAIFPMMSLVKKVRESELSGFTTPLLLLYSESDQRVDAAQTKAAFAKIGAPLKNLVSVTYSESRAQHVLAGDILAPKATAPMVASILEWLKAVPPPSP